MATHEFSYSEVKIWFSEETKRWFFRVNPDPLVEVDPHSRQHFGDMAHILTKRAIDDWMSMVTPPGPTANRIVVISDGDGTVSRIFDASVHDSEGVGK